MPKNLRLSLERILLTLWVGGMWTTGFVVTPVIFSSVADRMLAGNIAGRLFSILSLVGLVCGGLLLLMRGLASTRLGLRDWRLWVLVTMLMVIAVGEFGVAPRMQALKSAAGAGFAPDSVAYGKFALLHQISSSLFLVNSLLGLLLVAVPVQREVFAHGP